MAQPFLYYMYFFIFFACPLCPWVKENEAKEMAPVSLGPSDFLVLLKNAVSLKTRFDQTVQTPFSASSVVLSECQVSMGNSEIAPLRGNQGRVLWARFFTVRILKQPKRLAVGYQHSQQFSSVSCLLSAFREVYVSC